MVEHAGISRVHAEIVEDKGRLLVRDLESTNGTFVNRVRVEGEQALSHGDILHLADLEFRLLAEYRDSDLNLKMTRQGIAELPENMPTGSRELQELLVRGNVTAALQPIVESQRGHAVFAYEILGRGTHPSLSASPKDLFRVAESLNQEVRLSEMMRRVGVRKAYQFDPRARYFSNIHPMEMEDQDRLLESLSGLLSSFPGLRLVLEIHESAVTDAAAMAILREQLRERQVELAYDDFGAGQARLVELAEVPPDFIKLDIALIREVDRAAKAKQDMVMMLARYARESGIRVVAEGISSRGEADFCRHIGCDLMQGFLFGKPVLAA